MTNINIKFSHPEELKNGVVVELVGQLDVSNIDHVEEEMQPYTMETKYQNIILDLKGLTYLNSRAVGMMVNFYNQLTQQGKRMVLCNLSGGVQDTLTLVGVGQIMEFFDDLESAIEYMMKAQA